MRAFRDCVRRRRPVFLHDQRRDSYGLQKTLFHERVLQPPHPQNGDPVSVLEPVRGLLEPENRDDYRGGYHAGVSCQLDFELEPQSDLLVFPAAFRDLSFDSGAVPDPGKTPPRDVPVPDSLRVSFRVRAPVSMRSC